MQKYGTKSIYIIILNWNRKKDIIKYLQSLKNIKYSNFNIVAMDNGSIDGSQKNY